jgi:hypothetical protein
MHVSAFGGCLAPGLRGLLGSNSARHFCEFGTTKRIFIPKASGKLRPIAFSRLFGRVTVVSNVYADFIEKPLLVRVELNNHPSPTASLCGLFLSRALLKGTSFL